MGLVILLILAAIVLVIIGLIIKGLFYLLVIGVIVFVLALIFGAVRSQLRRRRPRR